MPLVCFVQFIVFFFLSFFNIFSSSISFLVRSLFTYTLLYMKLFFRFFASLSIPFLSSLVFNSTTNARLPLSLFPLLYILFIISYGFRLPISLIKSQTFVQSSSSFSLSLFVPSSNPFITKFTSFDSLFIFSSLIFAISIISLSVSFFFVSFSKSEDQLLVYCFCPVASVFLASSICALSSSICFSFSNKLLFSLTLSCSSITNL